MAAHPYAAGTSDLIRGSLINFFGCKGQMAVIMKRFLFYSLILMSSILTSSQGWAQERVTIGVGSFNLNNLPYYVALGLNAFAEQGLEVTGENFATGGSSVLQALLARSIDVGVGFYDHTIQLQSRGKDLVAFVLLARNSGLVLAVGRKWDGKITDVKSLLANAKELKFGVTSPGSSSDFFVRYLLQANGLNPKEAKVVGVGSGQSALAALKQGQIDVLVNYDPAATMLSRSKVGTILIDARNDAGAKAVYGGIYPTSTLYASREFLQSRKATVQKIANAMVKTLTWMANHTPAEVVAKIPPKYVSGDRDSYIEALANTQTLFSKDGAFEPKDLETPLKVLQTFNKDVKAKSIDLQKTYTNDFVNKAQRGGK